jgi:hypothetical protein
LLAHDWFTDSCIYSCSEVLPKRCNASAKPRGMRLSRQHPSFTPVLGWIATRGPHMNRFRLATSTMLVGVLLATGCASPCGGCRDGLFHRVSMFRARRACACPCECCSSCGGGVPIVGTACSEGWGDGPILEPPGPPLSALPPPPTGAATPAPLPPSLGAPLGTPADPGRLNPVPNGAQPLPAEPSSRLGRR